MHVTGSLAQRYLDDGFELERPPLPAPFDFLAVADPDGDRAPRLAVFRAGEKVGAAVLVDVRLLARDLGARAVFHAPAFTDDARRIAERFGIELHDDLRFAEPDPSPASAPPLPVDDVPPPFPELAAPEGSAPPFEPALAVDPVLAAEAGARPDFADFPEWPTHEELRDELRHVNAVLDAPEEVAEEPPAPAVVPPAFFPAPVEPFAQVTEAALALDPVEAADDLADLARWYEDLLAVEAADRDADLVRWYDDVLALEERTLAEEAAERHAAAAAALPDLARAARVLREPSFAPSALAALAFREIEAAIPGYAAPPDAVDPWAELATVAQAHGLLALPPAFSAGALAGAALRALADGTPVLPEEPEAAAEAEPEPIVFGAPPEVGQAPYVPMRQVLPWTPAPLPPHMPAEARLFLDAFNRAQTWRTLQRIEETRQEAHDSVVAQTDAPKTKTPEAGEDFELL